MPITLTRMFVSTVFGLATMLLAAVPVAQNTADADAHKAWMNNASDAQEDFRAALAEKDLKAAADAMTKLERLMAETESYWSARKMADGVKLAQATRAFAAAGVTSAKAGRLADANDAFAKMNSKCNECHELHLERR
jgi:hypothetical protein